MIASAKKSIFVAGADLKTLLRQAQCGDVREFIVHGGRVLNRLAELKIPTAQQFTAHPLAAGMKSRWLATSGLLPTIQRPEIGLPETTLGLVPAWGGCTVCGAGWGGRKPPK